MSVLLHACHNQGDKSVSPARGWDVQCLTERSNAGPPSWAERHTSRKLKGLAIDWNPDVLEVRRKGSSLAHLGLVKVSPNRGTLWVAGTLVETDVRVAVICSHRINDPDGSAHTLGAWRRMLWRTHAALDRRLAERFERDGYLVFQGSDINDHDAGLDPLERIDETRGHYDALGHSRDERIRLAGLDKGRFGPSDHSRFTATYAIKGN